METPIRIAKPAERGADLRVSGRARERRIVSTRVPNGRVLPVYGNKGGGKTLMEAGAVMADMAQGWRQSFRNASRRKTKER